MSVGEFVLQLYLMVVSSGERDRPKLHSGFSTSFLELSPGAPVVVRLCHPSLPGLIVRTTRIS